MQWVGVVAWVTVGAILFGAWWVLARSWGWRDATVALWSVSSALAAAGVVAEIPFVIPDGVPRGVRVLFFGKILWVAIFCVTVRALHYDALIPLVTVFGVPLGIYTWLVNLNAIRAVWRKR